MSLPILYTQRAIHVVSPITRGLTIMRIMMMFLLCILVSGVNAQDPRSMGPQQATGKNIHSVKPAKNPVADERGTEEKPIVIKGFPVNKTADQLEVERRDRDEKLANEKRLTTWTIVLAGATIFLALVAVGQFCMFWAQLSLMKRGAQDTAHLARSAATNAEASKVTALATEKSVEIMKDTAQKQLRAYVSVDTTKVVDPSGNELQQIGISIRNGGQTPAYRLRSWTRAAVNDRPLKAPVDSPQEDTAHGWTLLDAKDTRMMKLDYPPVSAADKEAVLANKKALYLWGEVSYDDIFGTRRYTRFSYVRDAANLPIGYWKHCLEGNEAT